MKVNQGKIVVSRVEIDEANIDREIVVETFISFAW